jgi:hypothetical protein
LISHAPSRSSRVAKSVAGSSIAVLNDFGLKKQRALLTLKQIDEQQCGVVKAAVFMNLLHCMDMTIDDDALNEIEKQFCAKQKGTTFVKYENALRILKFNNATENWTFNPN